MEAKAKIFDRLFGDISVTYNGDGDDYEIMAEMVVPDMVDVLAERQPSIKTMVAKLKSQSQDRLVELEVFRAEHGSPGKISFCDHADMSREFKFKGPKPSIKSGN